MKQSNSYKEFKERTQDIFNFAVLITLSIPVLKENLKLFNNGTIKRIPDPDFFEPSVIYEITQETLDSLEALGIAEEKIKKLKLLKNVPLNNAEFKAKVTEAIGIEEYKKNRNAIKRQSGIYVENISTCSIGYQSKLATYLYFSTFSFFEAFITDLSYEIIRGLNKIDKNKYIESFKRDDSKVGDMIKLSKPFDPRKMDRYKKYSQKIRSNGYVGPESLMYSTLTDIYNSKIENLRANEIPLFLEKTLLYKMTDDDKKTFHSIRNNRNSIGHGANGFSPNLNDVIAANKFFKTLSDGIDKHVTFYFFRLQNYQAE